MRVSHHVSIEHIVQRSYLVFIHWLMSPICAETTVKAIEDSFREFTGREVSVGTHTVGPVPQNVENTN